MNSTENDITETMSDEEWQSEGEWDEDAEICEPRAEPVAVQAVRFSLAELNAIREAAKRAGMRTSHYIRKAAAEKVERETHRSARTRTA